MTAETAGMGGAPGEHIAPPPAAVILEPRHQANLDFATTLNTHAEMWAPGAAHADWEEFPVPLGEYAHIPSLLRIGTMGRGEIPVLVPVLGEGHLTLGDPTLAKRVQQARANYRSAEKEEAEAAQRRAKAETAELEKQRITKIKEERGSMTDIAVGLMTRAVASTTPGSVQLTVYDPTDRARAFSGFSPMGTNGMFHAVGQGGLSGLLERLDDHILHVNQSTLQGFPSLRSLTEITDNPPPTPWQLVTLLGDGRPLDPADQERLNNIVRNGPACGVSLIMHGFTAPQDPTVRHITAVRNRASSSNLPNISFDLDTPPPPQVVRATAINAVRNTQAVPQIDYDPTLEIPTAAEYAYGLPGNQYGPFVTRAVTELRKTQQAIEWFEADHPFLTAQYLDEQLRPSFKEYATLVAAAAADESVIRAELRRVFRTVNTTDQMMAWAAFTLLRDEPGHARLELSAMEYGAPASRTILPEVERLADIVAITRRHGIEEIPEFMRAYTAQFLPNRPPAWAFQLVADAARPGIVSKAFGKGSLRAAEALNTDLENTYGIQLRDETGREINQDFTDCLAECRLLELYNYEGAPQRLREVLMRRTHRRLERIDREHIPERALAVYDACLADLARLGRIDNRREKIGGALGALGTRIGGLLAREKGDEEPDAAEDTEQDNRNQGSNRVGFPYDPNA